jgi:preprotein translocase SecE subunit
MPAKQRFVLLGLVGLTAVMALVLGHGLAFAMAQWGIADAPQFGLTELPLSKLIGTGLALLTTLTLYRVPASRTWLGEVTDELGRVNWPSREETTHATVVVVVCVVVSALFLGLFDATWLWISSTIMGVNGPQGG